MDASTLSTTLLSLAKECLAAVETHNATIDNQKGAGYPATDLETGHRLVFRVEALLAAAKASTKDCDRRHSQPLWTRRGEPLWTPTSN